MRWFILTNIFSALRALLQIGRLSDREEDLEILILRVLTARLKCITNRSIAQFRSIITLS